MRGAGRRGAVTAVVAVGLVCMMAGTAAATGAGAVADTADVPVDPSADQARHWLEDELLRPEYHVQPTLLERVLQWLGEQLQRLMDLASRVDGGSAAALVAVVVVVVVAVALLAAGPVRRARTQRRASHEVLTDDARTAAQLRADADAHAAAGRWAAAVLDRFRAILRSLEERAVLDERPGRTADEAAAAASVRFPGFAGALAAAGALFDEVAYGDVVPTGEDDRRLRELDAALARTRPARADQGPQDPADGSDVDLLDPRTAGTR